MEDQRARPLVLAHTGSKSGVSPAASHPRHPVTLWLGCPVAPSYLTRTHRSASAPPLTHPYFPPRPNPGFQTPGIALDPPLVPRLR